MMASLPKRHLSLGPQASTLLDPTSIAARHLSVLERCCHLPQLQALKPQSNPAAASRVSPSSTRFCCAAAGMGCLEGTQMTSQQSWTSVTRET